MLINLINAWNPGKKSSVHQNLCLNIILKIVFSQEKNIIFDATGIKKRLMRAVENLNHPQLDQRLAGILELDKIMQAHTQCTWEVIEILSEFVRKNTSNINPAAISSMKMSPDIQASLSAIAKKDTQKYLESELIDLSYTDLRGANLSGANFAGANLYKVNLSDVNLSNANLSGAILSAANLRGANLAGANLSGAILSAANLRGANLGKTNLSRANLYLANLCETNLHDAMLDGANLREAKFSG